MCLVTPPGYVHEYGETRAIRIVDMVAAVPELRNIGARGVRLYHRGTPCRRGISSSTPSCRSTGLATARRRARAEHKREFIAACEDFAEDHLLRAFSLVGTRGDADLMLLTQAENLERIHEFHVVLRRAG